MLFERDGKIRGRAEARLFRSFSYIAAAATDEVIRVTEPGVHNVLGYGLPHFLHKALADVIRRQVQHPGDITNGDLLPKRCSYDGSNV